MQKAYFIYIFFFFNDNALQLFRNKIQTKPQGITSFSNSDFLFFVSKKSNTIEI